MNHGSPGWQALARARAASSYARRTGCAIEEAGAAVDEGADIGHLERCSGSQMSRRSFLGGSLAVAAGAMLPGRLLRPAHGTRLSDDRVVIVGSGIAGLGCAYRLWTEHGIRSEVYEYNAERAGGRIETLRGFFDQGQYAEQHGEFISSEHVAVRHLAARFGLVLDDVLDYPPRTHPQQYQYRFAGKAWSQLGVNKDWHEWGWEVFNDAAFVKAPWPTLYNRSTEWARRWDRMSGTDWIEAYIPGGLDSDFGRLCVCILLDEYGGPVEEQSALNLVYLLGDYDSRASGVQPKSEPELSGTDEKWHIHGGNDQLISGLLDRLPARTVRLGQRLVALSSRGSGRWTCTFSSGSSTYDVVADEVVLAVPFTKLRQVDMRDIDLPPAQLRAIREEPLGSNSKIQLQFSRRVWNDERHTGNACTDEIGQQMWETSIDQPGPHGIMIGLPGGAEGAEIGARYHLTDYHGEAPNQMVKDYLASYEQFWPGISAVYSGKGYYAWSSGDPHIGGAYSYLKVGQYTGFNGTQSRRRGTLNFAGEQTSVNFQGYMEGGLRSGYRCAVEITGPGSAP